jgi:hypothetical protein
LCLISLFVGGVAVAVYGVIRARRTMMRAGGRS